MYGRAVPVRRSALEASDRTWFIHVGDLSVALSDAAAESTDAGIQALTSAVRGLVMLTRTCDIVRSCAIRPYVECVSLVEVDEAYLHVERGRRPSHTALPALTPERLVVDLDHLSSGDERPSRAKDRLTLHLDVANGCPVTRGGVSGRFS